MTFDRRQFIEVVGLGSAGLLVGCSKEPDKPAPSPTTTAGATASSQAVSLNLIIWGTALYAFSNNGQKIEVAYLTADPEVPGCTFVAHQPMLAFPAGGAKIVAAKTTVKLGPKGELPPGEYKIAAGSLSSGAGVLNAEGLNETPGPCAGPASTVRSLAYVPTLKAKHNVYPQWRERFSTRFLFEHGELRAHAPFHGETELARWDVRGPDAATAAAPFTDTLELTIPLAGNSVTFTNAAGETLTLETDGDPTKIEARLMAHPPVSSAPPLKVGDPEPHLCALYAVFEPRPAQPDRAELFFKDWCVTPTSPPQPGVPTGPAPGRYCTGAKIAV